VPLPDLSFLPTLTDGGAVARGGAGCAPSRDGDHRVVVLSASALIRRLGAVTVAVLTSTGGPSSTHLPTDRDAGLIGDDVSYINATALHTVDKARLHRRRGLLHPGEKDRLEDAIRLYFGL
jgi:mRNA interferase MazF